MCALMPELLALMAAAFGVSLALVPACRALALRFGYVAAARDDRWHRRPTALLGGVAIAVTVLGMFPFVADVTQLGVLMAGAGAMFLLGLVDDIVSLRPYTKLVVEIAVASVFVFFGYSLQWTDWAAVDMMLTMLWIVGLTNALNLLDNMDGLCAGIAVIAGASLLGAFMIDGGATPQAIYLALLLGALGGFLVYNFHPASVFMGDSGSLFIGLSLAVLTLGTPDVSHSRTNLISILIGPLLVLLVPIFDTVLVTVSRLLSGRSAAQGGRDHASHRLVALGLSEREAVAVLWAMAALSGLLAVSIYRFQGGFADTVGLGFLIAMVIVAVYLARVRVYRTDSPKAQSVRLTPFVADFMYKRRMAEVCLDFCLSALAYQAAYRLRFEGPLFNGYYENFITSLPIVVGVQSIALYAVGAYRGVWRYFGLMDGVTFAKGVALGALASVSIIVYLYRFEDYSRGVFVIYAALLMLMLCGSRASFRLFSEFAQRRRPGQRLVIYGTGEAAATAVHTIREVSEGGCRVLGFIDDDPLMARVRMQGYAVLGGYAILMQLVASREVDAVVIATPVMDVERLERLRRLCVERNVSLSRLHVELSDLVAVS